MDNRLLEITCQLKYLKWIFTCLIALGQSCSSPEINETNPYDYFPLDVGRFQVYQVKEEVYSAGQASSTVKVWYEKNEIVRMSKNSDVSATAIVSQSVRNNPSDYWQKIKEYSIQSFPDKIVLNKDNEIFTSLIFPYNPTVKWDGYQYFNIDKDDPREGYLFHYEDLDEPLTIDSLKFDKTFKVSERSDTTSEVYYKLGFKQYANGIGMISDEQTDFEYAQENGQIIGHRVIGSGTRRFKKIIAYGK